MVHSLPEQSENLSSNPIETSQVETRMPLYLYSELVLRKHSAVEFRYKVLVKIQIGAPAKLAKLCVLVSGRLRPNRGPASIFKLKNFNIHTSLTILQAVQLCLFLPALPSTIPSYAMAFTDEALKAKLSTLNESQDSIVSVSQWIMFHR